MNHGVSPQNQNGTIPDSNLLKSHSPVDRTLPPAQTECVQAASLVRTIEDFLAGAQEALVLEERSVLFDLSRSKYSLNGEQGKCLLHMWSDDRNTVRRVLAAEVKNGVLRLAVQKMGQARPSRLEICRRDEERTPSERKAARAAYRRRLERILERQFPEFRTAQFTSSMDLERSFGPVHARGLIRRGQTAFAILGAGEQETQASVDASLTFGILWLETCRERLAGKALAEGLKLFVPRGRSEVARERMAHLNPKSAKWQLYEIDERDDSITELDCADRGNFGTRLVRCPEQTIAHARFADAIARVLAVYPEAETALLSPAEIAFRCHGLEFARARIAADSGSFRREAEIVFGVGAEENILSDANAARFQHHVHEIAEVRHAEGPRDHILWRLHPERWLETMVTGDVSAVDERLDSCQHYSQVPAFSRSDRAIMDVLAVTREGRLAVIELKADEDLHLPLQGLDYWARVAWHHARGEFQKFGYFPGRELSPEPPLLFFVAPALHVHPSTDTLLRYLSSEVEWIFVGIDERWRQGVRPVFRKRPN